MWIIPKPERAKITFWFSPGKKKKKEVENTSKYSGVTLNKGVEVWCQFPPRSKGSPVKLRRFNTHSAPPFSPWATDSKTASLRGVDKGISPALCLVCTPTSAEKKRDRTGLCTAGKLTLTQEELQERQDLNCTACVRQIQYSHAAKSQRGLIAHEDARNQVLKGSEKEDCRSSAPTGPEPFQSAVRCPPRQGQSAFKLCLIEKTFFFNSRKTKTNEICASAAFLALKL